MDRPFDHLARRYTLNWAIATVVLWTAYFCIGFAQLAKYFRGHDTFYLFVGSFNMFFGFVGVYLGWQITHAVARRMTAQSRTDLTAPVNSAASPL